MAISYRLERSVDCIHVCCVGVVMAQMQSDRAATVYQKLRTRYDALTARATAGGSLVPDTAYADFLKSVYVLS